MKIKSKNSIEIPVNWEKVFSWSAFFLVAVTIIALIARLRTLVVLFSFLDVLCVFGLLCVTIAAFIAKSKAKNSQPNNQK